MDMSTDEKIRQAREAFEKAKCPGVVALIDLLVFQRAAGQETISVGGTLDLHGVIGGPLDEDDPEEMAEAFLKVMALPHPTIGNKKVHALDHLVLFSESIGTTTPKGLALFNSICDEMVKWETAPGQEIVSLDTDPPTLGRFINRRN